ncbi:MAG TPA: prepilin-type N-terminal cleavage/methylation domain-containing protein [Solirubrobacteraceae bacterium]|nr:prepilin-type N-terminal cleavage/methylation domain-containing protein [Solirubrobacteraceae bacterium]
MTKLSLPQTHWLTWRCMQTRLAACDESGFTLIELLIAATLFLVVVGAAMTVMVAASNTQARDQAYAIQVQTSQVALAKLMHDLRDAESPVTVGPGTLQFRVVVPGSDGSTTAWNVKYDCTAPDSLGAPYTRCARTQAVAPNSPPSYASTAGAQDIQHVWNNPTNTQDLGSGNDYSAFCKPDGSAPSGSVFYAQNPNIADTNTSPPACDQTYQLIVGNAPDYVKVRVQVPSGGDQPNSAIKHYIVLSDGTYLPNLDQTQ